MLLDILSSLESVDIVTIVVDKTSKEKQLLALPAGLRGSCCLSLLFTHRGMVRRRVKIDMIESMSERVILITCWSCYFHESVHEGYIGARYSPSIIYSWYCTYEKVHYDEADSLMVMYHTIIQYM